jgi:hypothetical protein
MGTYARNHAELINTMCGQNGEPLVLKPGLETLIPIKRHTGS